MSDSTDPVIAYKEAYGKLQTAHYKACGLVKPVAEAAFALLADKWKLVDVTGHRFPVGQYAHTINAATWPTGAQLGEALSEWHRAREEAKRLLKNVPQDRQKEVDCSLLL